MSLKLVFRRYAPFKTFGGGFEGDDRTEASTDPAASARTIGVVAFDMSGVQSSAGSSSGSTFKGLGAWVERRIGRAESKVLCSLSNVTRSASQISFIAQTAGANPLVPGAPRIITIVKLSASWTGNALRVSGAVLGDNFPNAEVILYDGANHGRLLFDFHTTGGQTTGPFTRLPSTPGGHDSQQLGQFSTTIGMNARGEFIGV
jgi:hypothetical protein